MEFVDITIDGYEQIHGFCSMYGENSCQHSFINMFTLKEKYGSKSCIQDGFLYVLRENLGDENFRTYLFPMGEGNQVQAVQNLLADASSHGKKLKFQTITESKKNWLEANFPGQFEFSEDRDYAEYIYYSQKLIDLPGNFFQKKRREVRKFLNDNEGHFEIKQITRNDREAILEFEQRWLMWCGSDENRRDLDIELKEMEVQLDNFDRLGLSGIIIKIDGKIEAVAYGMQISPTIYDLLIAKANRDFYGIYRVLYLEVVKQFAAGVEYLSLEEDIGVEGLRKMKLGYQPDILLRKYIVVQK